MLLTEEAGLSAGSTLSFNAVAAGIDCWAFSSTVFGDCTIGSCDAVEWTAEISCAGRLADFGKPSSCSGKVSILFSSDEESTFFDGNGANFNSKRLFPIQFSSRKYQKVTSTKLQIVSKYNIHSINMIGINALIAALQPHQITIPKYHSCALIEGSLLFRLS